MSEAGTLELASTPDRVANGGGAYVVLLATLCIGQLGRIPLISSELKNAPILALDVGVGLLWLLLMLYVVRHPNAIRFEKTSLFVTLFASWSLLGIVLTASRYGLSVSQIAFSSMYTARWLFYFGVYLWLTTVPGDDAAPQIVSRLTTAILAFAVFGIFQSAFLPDFAFMVYPEAVPYHTWDIQGHRLVSTFLDPNFAGNLIGVALLLMLPAIVRRGGSLSIRFLLLLVALFLTASRGSVGGVLIGGIIVLWTVGFRAGLRLLPKLAAVGLAVLFVSVVASWAAGTPSILNAAIAYLHDYNKLTITDPSALDRLWSWAKDIELVVMHPITGIGFDTLGFVQDRVLGVYRSDNASFGLDGGLLFIAALTGIVGVILYMWIMGLAVVRGIRLARDKHAPTWARDVGAATVGATLMWVAQGFFVNSLLYPFLMVTFWLLWGLVTMAWRERRSWQPVGAPPA